MASAVRTTLQHRVWRWHFMAGLMVVPFAVILAVTGAIYLFKPQFDAAVEGRINSRAAPLVGDTLPADALLVAAREAYPEGSLIRLVMPSVPDDPTLEAEMAGPDGPRTLWLDRTSGEVLHDTSTDGRFMNVVKRIHGTLLGGNAGSLLVEIMASWMIILIVTGVYLWWPRGQSWWRVFLPGFSGVAGRREGWRRVHGMAGAWAGAVILLILLFGLPWTQVWGEGYTRVKALAGLKAPGQEWFVTLQSSDPHADHAAHGMLWDRGEGTMVAEDVSGGGLPLQAILEQVRPGQYPPPVWVQPPRGENGVWTVRSMGPSRPGRVTAHYDRWTGEELMRITFADHNAVDRFVAQGVAFHEGQLYGPLNQLTGLLAAASVVLLSLTGALMWWRRRPNGRLGLPPMPADRRIAAGLTLLVACFCIFLPMAGGTLVIALAADFIFGRATGRARKQRA